jgi:hypothetical protein
VRYEALRDINIPRHLGIPHPECYAVQALAIAKHWKVIAEHCNKPNPTISRVHVRHVGDGRIFEMNYKGTERFQLEEDEIQWMTGAQYLVEADVASCFPSIYTHCIPWALHGKAESKKTNSLTALSGNLLDKCTQNTRDRQTNGLLIGPHASNIISEIILTRIDAELQSRGYLKIVRHVDDYRFYASTVEEAEDFIRDLGLCLRTYEMSLNEKKTQILNLPRPSDENWRLVLNRFIFPTGEDIRFSVIRSYLDLALECAQAFGKSTPLNYAIKTLAGHGEPRKLNGRAKRMYSQEAINLALAFPYLAPLLDECVFTPYWHAGMKEKIADFSTALIRLGAKRIYPDAIARALFLALKYQIALGVSETELVGIVQLDDCVANVMNEAETRAEHIDPALKAAGWGVVEGSRILREHGITQGRLQGGGKRAKAEIADYVLVYRNTKLAVIEAKAWDKPYTEGVGRPRATPPSWRCASPTPPTARRSTASTWPPAPKATWRQYPSPDELWNLTFAEANAWRDRFAAIPFEDKGGTWQGRYYQDIAITRVLEAIAEAGATASC